MDCSLYYEVLMYLNIFYFATFAAGELIVALFKVKNLPFPALTLILEFLLLTFVCISEFLRISIARSANFMDKSFAVMVSMALSVPSIIGTIYFLFWQTYVLKLEIILCSIQLTMQALEFVLGFFHCFKLFKSKFE